MNIGVIFGGKSLEHDVSIITAFQVINNLDLNKYKVIPIYISKDNTFKYIKPTKNFETFKNKTLKLAQYALVNYKGSRFIPINRKFHKSKKIDLIINCTHGFGVEDGTISSLLNFLNIPNTSCPLETSAILQNKYYTKVFMKELNVKTLEYNIVKSSDFSPTLKYPLILKPIHLGSSIGISIVNNNNELNEAIKKALIYDDTLILEPFISEMIELEVACYKRLKDLHISCVEIINKKNKYFDFSEKYLEHHKTNKKEFVNDSTIICEIKNVVENIYLNLNLKGIVRFDFFYINNELYLNEINTIPGALSNYLFKNSISFKLLLDEQIREAYYQNSKQNTLKEYKSTILDDINFIDK